MKTTDEKTLKKKPDLSGKKGFFASLMVSITCLFFFFSPILTNPNHSYLGSTGDGLQAYFTAIYHVKHDKQYWHFDGMNYPKGEQVFYSGCQPLVTNFIKLLMPVVDLSDYTVAILNLLMLGSIVLCSCFIYLIFKHLKLPVLVSVAAATAIAFLSPQMERLGGHYSLTYQFGLPLLLYLLLKFHEQPTLKKSIWIGVSCLFFTATHFYFFAFFALVLAFYFFVLFLRTWSRAQFKFSALHFSIQVIIPFALVQLITVLTDSAHDRTSYPWGYMEYRSNLSGVFFNGNRIYSSLLKPFFSGEYSWEGRSYVGILALVIFLTLIALAIRKLFRRKFREIPAITNHFVLNTWFWISIIGLLISFGFPFIIRDWHKFLPEVDFINQLRGIGRFAWIFYYGINIIAVYKLNEFLSHKKKVVSYPIWILSIGLLAYDAYVMSSNVSPSLNNRIAALEDTENNSDINQWMKRIQIKDYQTLIQLPYFHVGSENIWWSNESEMRNRAFITSIKTGIPLMMVNLSRTSLSETYDNIELFMEPYHRPELLNRLLRKGKPILVLASEKEMLPNELELLKCCKKIDSTTYFSIYRLEPKTISARYKQLYKQNLADYQAESKNLHSFGIFSCTDSVKSFLFTDFDQQKQEHILSDKQVFSASIVDYNIIYEGKLPTEQDSIFTLSFWAKGFKQDLVPRTTVELTYLDENKNALGTYYFQFKDRLKVFDENDALIESDFTIPKSTVSMRITMWNDNFYGKKQKLKLDNLLIQKAGTKLYRFDPKKQILFKNNRIYKSDELNSDELNSDELN